MSLITKRELAEKLLKGDPDEKVYAVIWEKIDLMPDLPQGQEWSEAQVEKVMGTFAIEERSWDAIGDDENYARGALDEFRCHNCYEYDLNTISRECPSCGEEEEII